MDNLKQEWSRRKFVLNLTGAGTTIMLSPLISRAFNADDRVARIVANTIGIDAHNHIDVPLNAKELPGPKVDLAGDIKKSGLSAICMTFALDYQKLTEPGEAYDRFTNGLNAMDELLKSNNMKRALNLADIKSAHKNHKQTVIQSVEGGHFLEGQIERLELAYKRGLRFLGLLHDNDASVPLGDIYTKPAQWGGLTEFGANTIKECNRLGILIDLTHCSDDTMNAALKLSSKPVLTSHTGLNTQLGQNANMAKMMMPRLISKEQAKKVADQGGVVGVWTHLSETPLEYAQNIRAMVDIVGVDHVCFGTDTKMTPSYRPPGDSGPKTGQDKPNNPKEVLPNDNNGKNNSGADKRPARPGERTNEAWQYQKVGFYYAVVDAMLKTGFSENEIGKIGGGNFLRIFDAATANH